MLTFEKGQTKGGQGRGGRQAAPHSEQSRGTYSTRGKAARPLGSSPGTAPVPPLQGGGTHHAGVGKPYPCAGLLRVKLFIDFAHFGPGRGKLWVVGGEQQVARAMQG